MDWSWETSVSSPEPMESWATGSELASFSLHLLMISFHYFCSQHRLLSCMEKTVIFAPLFGRCSTLALSRDLWACWGGWSRKLSLRAWVPPYTCHDKSDWCGTFHFPIRPFWSGCHQTRFPTILGGSTGYSTEWGWVGRCIGLLPPLRTLVWAAWNSKSPKLQTLFVTSL